MSGESEKRRAGKKRMRHELASMPVEDKLRVVEQLREDKINPSAQQASMASDSQVEPNRQEQTTTVLQIVQEVAEGKASPQGLPVGNSSLVAEIKDISEDKLRALKLLNVLFPTGVPNSIDYFNKLIALQRRFGWNETSNQLAAALLSAAVEQSSVETGEALLHQIPKVSNPYFFQLLDVLPIFLPHQKFRPQFVAPWVLSLLRRIGNDLASGSFFSFIDLYCKYQAHNALEVLQVLLTARSEEEITIAARILGNLRSFALDEGEAASFRQIDCEFATSATLGLQSAYNRSWVQTAWLGKMLKEDLVLLTKRFDEGGGNIDEAAGIIARLLLSPAIMDDCFEFGLGWLKANAFRFTSPVAKYHVVDFAARLPTNRRKNAAELILLIQPILAEHKGIWARLEHFLVQWLQNDQNGFYKFCSDFADLNAKGWLEVLNAPGSAFEWLFSELAGKAPEEFVGRLLLSASESCRKLGLFFYDKLKLSALPASLFDAVNERQIRIAFYELQRDLVHGDAIARYLVMLIPWIEKMAPDFQQEFYQELVRQLKNYGGACREEFTRRVNEYPILKKALEDVDTYLENLRKIEKSSIHAMEVAGVSRAARMHARKMSNEISKGTRELSVFMQFVKSVRLLYGKQWRSFQSGELGGSSELKKMSSTIELPRMEIIDPEDMALRRLYASAQIQKLSFANPIDRNK